MPKDLFTLLRNHFNKTYNAITKQTKVKTKKNISHMKRLKDKKNNNINLNSDSNNSEVGAH